MTLFRRKKETRRRKPRKESDFWDGLGGLVGALFELAGDIIGDWF